MAHASVVAIGKVAAATIEEGLGAVEHLLALLELRDVIEVNGVLDVHIDVDGHAAQGIGDAGEAVKVDLGVVRDLNVAQVAHDLDHSGRTVIGVDAVELHRRPLPRDHGVARDGEQGCHLLLGVDPCQDDGVGAVLGLSGAAVRAKKKDVVRVIGSIALGERLAQLRGHDLAVVHP